MGQITLSARGPCDAGTVWERYADPDLWPTWAPHIRGVEYAHERLVAGARGHVVGPLRLRVPFVVDAVDEAARTWSWSVTVAVGARSLVTVRLHHAVEPGEQGSQTSLQCLGPIVVLAGYAPIARYALHRLTR